MISPRFTSICRRTLAACALAVPASALADVQPTEMPFLWVIEGETPSYLYGTIHLPDDRVLAIPDVVDAAFESSDAVYTEIPMDMATMMTALGGMQLPDGTTLHDVVPEDLLERSEAYLKSRNLTLAPFTQFKVAFFATQLAILDQMAAMMTKQPLDAMLAARATDEGKETRALETVEEQIAVFDALSPEQSVEMLRLTLDYLEELDEKGTSPTDELVEFYLAGDADALAEKMYEYFDPDASFTQTFVELAIEERNRRMTERIQEWIAKEPENTHFFAVGTMHYPMDIGVLALLEGAGHKIRRLTPSDTEAVRETAMAPAGH